MPPASLKRLNVLAVNPQVKDRVDGIAIDDLDEFRHVLVHSNMYQRRLSSALAKLSSFGSSFLSCSQPQKLPTNGR